MSLRGRLGGYEAQLKTFLVLLVAFLAVAVYLSFHLTLGARDVVGEEVRRRIDQRTRFTAARLDLAAPVPGFREAILSSPYTQARLDRLARESDLVSVEILEPGGRVVVSSLVGRVAVSDAAWTGIEASVRSRIAGGETLFSPLLDRSGIAYATMVAFRPILDSSGILAGVLRVEDRADSLARIERNLKVLTALQAIGLGALLVLVLYFARWILSPYRRLAATAGEARGLNEPGAGVGPEPDFLVASFQAVLGKLRAQEQELVSLRSGRGDGRPGSFPAERLAESLTSGMMSLDREGRIRMVNPAAVAILGRSRSSLEGTFSRDAFGQDTGLGRLLREGLDRMQPRSREMVPHVRPDGREIHLGVGLSPVVEASGEAAGMVCLLSDLTEIRALREKVALKENLAQLGELSAGIAHEFRNSLATMLGYARLIGRGEGGDVADLAGSILKEGQGIGKVVESYLQYARPAALNLAEVDLRSVLEELAREFATPTPDTPFRVVLRGDFPRLRADEAILKQAFHNLIRNAADAATGPGGQVTITGLPSERGMARVEVADDGCGIPPEILPRIFTPFFTTRPNGTGLGLPLVQKAIVSHDGTVEVNSRPGGGTRFLIRLPLPVPPGLSTNL